MKLLKKIIPSILVFSLVFLSQSVFAQGRHHHPEKMLEKMKTELNLNDTQVEQIKTIFEEGKTKMQALKKESGEDSQAKREQRKAWKENQKAAIEKVLTAEQLTKFQAMDKHRKGKRGKKGARMSKEDRKAMHAEVKAYKEKNIVPVLREQRVKLDQSISQEDQASIQNLRPKLEAEKALRKAEHKKVTDAFMKGKKPAKKEYKKMKAERKKRGKSESLKTAESLVEKYEAPIDALLAEIKDQQKKWDEDIRAIRKKYKEKAKATRQKQKGEENAKDADHETRAHAKKGHKRHKKMRGKKRAMRKEKKKLHFLMLDTNVKETEASNSTHTVSKVNIYPNPSISENTLQFEVAEAGNLSIELTDKSGTLIRSIDQSYREAGTYSINVNLNNLKNGVYYYTIKDKNGKLSTQKFVLMQ